MLSNALVFTTIPVRNLKRAKDFYVEKLGLKQVKDPSKHGYMLEAGNGSKLFIFQTDKFTASNHVVAAFFIDNIERIVNELINKGIIFEKQINGMSVEINQKGIASGDKEKAAWFKDPDGNILSLSQLL